MKKPPFSLKRSRRSFVFNYLTGIMLLLYIFLSGAFLMLDRTMTFFFISLVFIFFLEPEGVLYYRSFFIKEDNITEIKGYLSKKKTTIPYSSVSNIVMNKGIIGRVLGFGDVIITAYSGGANINLKGVKHPEKIMKSIENMIKRKV